MALLWRRRFPLTRMGLLVLVGALACSVFRFYAAFAAEASDLNTRDAVLEPRNLLRHFVNDFLFAGTEATCLFWAGVALLILGIMRNLMGPRT